MKMKILSSFLNTTVKTIFNRSFLVFGLLFLSVSLGGVFGQVTVSITAVQPNADEEGPVNGSYQVLVDGDNFSFYDVFLSIDGASTADVGDDFSGLPSSVRILTNGGGSGTALVGVSVIDDNIIENTETVVWSIDLNGGYMIDPGNSSAIVNIVDNDVAGVNVTAISGNTGEDGTTAFFTVTLDSQPSAPVTVALTSSNTAEGTVPNNVIIPVSNWNTGVSVTVTGIDDSIIDGNINYTIVTGNVTSTDANYDALGGGIVGDVSVINIDDDQAGVNVNTTTGITTEGGGTTVFTFTLTSQPTADVELEIDQYDNTETGGPSSITITPANWNTGADLLVTGLDDDIIDGDIDDDIRVRILNSADSDYDSLNNGDVPDIMVTNQDNDVASINISPISGNTTEAGGTATFAVTLGSQPTNNVTIALSSSNTGEGTVAASVLKTPANWNTNTTVTVTGIDDSVVDGDIGYSIITGNVTSADANYNALNGAAVADISVINSDNDVVGVNVSAISGNTTEAGGTATFAVTLGSQPTNNVTIALSSSNTGEGTVAASVLKTPANWNTNTTVTVTGVDDSVVDGDIGYSIITGNVTSSDVNYNGLNETTIADVAVTNVDNDIATLTILNNAQNEDDVSGNLVFNVVLDIAVVGGTQVSYSFFDDTATGGGTDYTGTPGNLIFTGTANETKTITVPINNDAVLENTETFEVQLGLPTNNVQLVNGGTAIGTINDDDNCVAAPVLDASVSPIYCVVDTGSAFSANLFDFTTSIAPSGTVLTWSRVSNPLTITSHLSPAEAQNISTPASYYGFFYDAANNCASGNIEVQIVRNIIPEILSITGNERCGPGTLLLSVTPSDGASVNWYDSLDAVTPIATGETYTTPSLTATTTYYVEATENECTTERQPVIARIGFQATTGTAQNGAICNVTANGLTSIDLDTRLTGADPGVWVFVSGPETNINISSTNVVDFEDLASGAYIFRFTTTNSTAPCVNPTVEVIINVSDCESDDDNDGLLGGQEVALGLDPNNPDTDGDGIEDGVEVGPDIANPLDEDSDGVIDALDSNTEDTDNDGVNNQQDPANNNPCIPNRFNGFCDTDGDGLSDLDEQTNGSDPDDPCDPVATPNCDDPIDLEVLKSVDNEDAQIGDTVVFEITVTNLSDRTARAIVVGDLLELGFDFVSKSSLDYDEVSGMWNIAELEAGLSTVLTITVTVSEEGPYENTATLLESIPSDGNTANDESTVTLNTEVPEGVDLLVEKEARPNKVLVGDEVEFIIKVTNISQTDVVTDIILNDFILVENGFEFVSAESDLNGVYDASTGNWTIPSLNLDETATLRIMARVPQTGVFNNTVNLVRSSPRDGNPLNDEATVEVEVIEKSQADPGFLYNQFSPNGNNQNEILRINRTDPVTRLEVTLQYNIKIYDRYGNLVFETEKVNDGDVWDGTYKGKEVPRGTYFYIMNYSINNEPAILDKGWIQLIR
ncbi:gliding motility-associated C-terminal domain-containing protein [uncultured Maribacter sp.]|uniref:Calx-beta domain-containing protein n=1 Tax=uncultured Maribacter sp. TaxID=431308 RepID=UPI0030ED37D9